jgi:tyrosine-protein kinase Etk/Wzc
MKEEQSASPAPESAAEAQDQSFGFLDLALVAAKHKRVVFGIPLLASIVAAICALLMPNIYTGRALIMPPQQQSATAATLLGQLGVLSSGGASSLGLKNPGDLYVGMLKSRTIADSLISRFKLADQFETDTMVETRRELMGRSRFTAGKDGLISIEYEDENPQRAADIANAYVDELDKLTQSIAVGEAGQRRLHFERQLKRAKEDLADAEVELKKTQERTGLIKIDEQGRAIIEAVASLRAQIAAKEVELASMRGTFATESNPEYVRAQEQFRGLRDQLKRLEQSQPAGKGDKGDIFVPTGKVPEAGLEYIRKLRDVKYFETMFELLAKQYEIAKLDEAKEGAIVQVVDKATPPDRKSKPMRLLIVLVTATALGILSLLYAFAREWIANAPSQSQVKLNRLKSLLRRRS